MSVHSSGNGEERGWPDPVPPSPRRGGFPWLGLILAVLIVAAVVAYLLGGTRGMLLTAIFYGVIAGPLALALMIFGAFRATRRKPDSDSSK